MISSSVLAWNGSKFSVTVPENRNGDCGIYPILVLNVCNPTSLILTPSISTVPLERSISLKSDYRIELLPAPVLPTIPTFMPGSISNVTSLTAGSRSSLYLI